MSGQKAGVADCEPVRPDYRCRPARPDVDDVIAVAENNSVDGAVKRNTIIAVAQAHSGKTRAADHYFW